MPHWCSGHCWHVSRTGRLPQVSAFKCGPGRRSTPCRTSQAAHPSRTLLSRARTRPRACTHASSPGPPALAATPVPGHSCADAPRTGHTTHGTTTHRHPLSRPRQCTAGLTAHCRGHMTYGPITHPTRQALVSAPALVPAPGLVPVPAPAHAPCHANAHPRTCPASALLPAPAPSRGQDAEGPQGARTACRGYLGWRRTLTGRLGALQRPPGAVSSQRDPPRPAKTMVNALPWWSGSGRRDGGRPCAGQRASPWRPPAGVGGWGRGGLP